MEEAALALGIAGLLERPTHELSGGELQRVALAAALVGRPQVVLLDEPTSQLDPVAGDELIWLLRRLNEEWGTTIVLAEHRLERCLPAADRVIAMAGGAVACDAQPRDFLAWAGAEAPALQTPAARLFERAGLRPLPSGVKEARATLRAHGLLPDTTSASASASPKRSKRRGRQPGLTARSLWYELRDDRAILRGIDLSVEPGEAVALMGRNGAGKSTLLRHAAGLLEPTRGRIEASGRVALLLQNPATTSRASAWATSSAPRASRPPGSRTSPIAIRATSRAASASASRSRSSWTASRPRSSPSTSRRAAWTGPQGRAGRHRARARRPGARGDRRTHDVEFAASFAQRVILLGDGVTIADGPAGEVLGGGWYFATETARVLGGAGGALLPEQGAELLRARLTVEVAP